MRVLGRTGRLRWRRRRLGGPQLAVDVVGEREVLLEAEKLHWPRHIVAGIAAPDLGTEREVLGLRDVLVQHGYAAGARARLGWPRYQWITGGILRRACAERH